MTLGDLYDDHLASLAADVSGRLDRFCADLQGKGMRVERDGFSVRITIPGAAPEFCGCNRLHPDGATMCYLCDLPLRPQ